MFATTLKLNFRLLYFVLFLERLELHSWDAFEFGEDEIRTVGDDASNVGNAQSNAKDRERHTPRFAQVEAERRGHISRWRSL